MAETEKVYRGLRRGDNHKKVEGQHGPLGHPTEPNPEYDWPGPGEGSLRLAEALLADAAGRDLSSAHAEEYAAEWVGELPWRSGPVADEFWRLLSPQVMEAMDELLRQGRRSRSGPPPIQITQVPSDFAVSGPGLRRLEASSPEEAQRLLQEETLERYYEDWRVRESEVVRWAHGRADTHAEARSIMEAGGGLLLIDPYGPLSRHFREIAQDAGRGADVLGLGAWPDAVALNLLERPDWISAGDLADLVASAVSEVREWPDARGEDAGSEAGEEWDEQEREEAHAPALLEDALLTLILANDALRDATDGEVSAGRYTLFDVEDLLMPPAGRDPLPEILDLIGDAPGSSGEPLAGSWERWRAMPAEVTDARARPILRARDAFREAPWARSFAADGGGSVDLWRRMRGAGKKKIVLADLSERGGPGSAGEVAELVLLRLFARGAIESGPTLNPHDAGDDPALPPVFLPGALREDPARFRRRGGRVAMKAMEARLRGLDVRPC